MLNLSSRVVDQDGRAYCIVATWNDDAALDDERLIAPYRSILSRLAAQEKADHAPGNRRRDADGM